MKPNQIKAVVGLYRISDFRGTNDIASESATGLQNTPYELEFKNIIAHENYDCRKPDNDIGTP